MNHLDRTKPFSGMSMKLWALGLALACVASVPCSATVVNGTFDTGLSGWATLGDVSAAAEASLGDSGTDYSLLYQGVGLVNGSYSLEFDFLNLLSADISTDPFAFPDAFFASLYFSNDLTTFDLAGGIFDDVAPLMDLDSVGPYNVSGVLSPSVLGTNWSHFTYDFTNTHAYVIPAFELLDFNFVLGDSEVRVDNVAISQATTVVPEPGTLTLLAMGLLGCVTARVRGASTA